MENKRKKGVAIGLSIGVAIGVALGNVAIGISVGLCCGIAFGSYLEKKDNDNSVSSLASKTLFLW